MLGTHADAFFMTPMRLSIATQATRIASGMPAPRPLSASATKIVNGNRHTIQHESDQRIPHSIDRVIPHGSDRPARGIGASWRPQGGAIPIPGVAPGRRALNNARPVHLQLHGDVVPGSMWNGMGAYRNPASMWNGMGAMPSTNTMLAVGGVVAAAGLLFWFLRK